MRWHRKLTLRLLSLFRKQKIEQELSEEFQFHLQRQMEEFVGQGMPSDEARYAALRALGGLEQLKEECRETRRVSYIEHFLQDLRFGLRQLWRVPGFTAVAVLTLALGIGANTAVFSVVDGVLLRPLPFSRPDRLVSMTDSYPEGPFVSMRSTLRTTDVATYFSAELNLTGMDDPVRLYGATVSAEFFSVLGAKARLGAVFQPGQDQPGKDNLAILSYSLWQQKFSGDAKIIGRSISLDGIDRQVIGIMPEDFQFPSTKVQLWIPLHMDPDDVGVYWGQFMPVFGRMRPGVTMERAGAEIAAFGPTIHRMFPWKMPPSQWMASNVISLQRFVAGNARTRLLLLLGAIGLVLLIACANVANLFLARAATRQREIAVRAALGASRSRIFRQLLTESIVLAMCGGVIGLLLAVKGLQLLKAILPANTPRIETIAMDWRVLLFTGVVAILTGILFGLAPALHASSVHLTEALKGRSTSSGMSTGHRLRSTFAVAEIAIAFVLVIAAGLMVKSLWMLAHVDPGFQPQAITSMRVTPSELFCSQFTRCTSFYDSLLDRVKALPGVTSAALVNALPLDGRGGGIPIDFDGYIVPTGEAKPIIWFNISSPDYLRLMGIPVLQGRAFTSADTAADAQPVVLVSAATAHRFWPGQDPIGKRLKAVWLKEWRTVVGVVGDVHEDQLTNRLPDWMAGEAYFPLGPKANMDPKHPPNEMTLLVRTSSDDLDIGSTVARIVSGLSDEVPVSDVRTLYTIVADSVAAPRSTMSLLTAFAGLALVLGAVGIYGVVSYSMVQRTAEIGLRMALGAQLKDVLRLVLEQGVRLVLVGVAIGILAALALTRLMAGLLFGVGATDPLTFSSVSILLTLVALAACYIPARRAMAVDPVIALRHE